MILIGDIEVQSPPPLALNVIDEGWHRANGLELCAALFGVTEQGRPFPIRCKSWDCPTCAALNARDHAIRCAYGIYGMILEGIRPKFATFTLRNAHTPEWAFGKLASMWDKLRGRFQYGAEKAQVPFRYATFVETHVSGIPHFHCVVSYGPKERELKGWAVKSGLGFMADISPLRNHAGVAWYVSKYGSKTSGKMGLPRGFKRVRYSNNWAKIVLQTETREVGAALLQHPNERFVDFALRVRQVFGKQCEADLFALAANLPEAKFERVMNGHNIVVESDD